jgi:hypothetical protein
MKRAIFAAFILSSTVSAAENPDLIVQSQIRREGFRNSKVMEIASGITDFIGPRLTGSPNMQRANEWTRDKLTEFGLVKAHLEPWGPFGHGWSYESISMRLTSPDVAELWALPRAWSPATNGVLRGVPVKAKIETKEDIEKYKGKLTGKFVMLGDPAEFKPHDKLQYQRYDEKTLEDEAHYEMPRAPRVTREEALKRRAFTKALVAFLAEEKPLAVITPGTGDFGTFHVQSAGSARAGEQYDYPVPAVVLSDEQYARITRLIDQKKEPQIELDVKSRYYENPETSNTIAEIPGGDKKDEIVMIGAHLDSWHGGTGATDNAAGCAAAMETVRIIKALGMTPRRTIRIALWSGEEQGLLGSRAYVAQHFATRTVPEEELPVPSAFRRGVGPLVIKPEHAKLDAYFNLDNGTGKVRGIYAQDNAAVVPIFESWLTAVHDLGATTVTMNNTGSTDHVPFDEVGLPGFQFIQDQVEYRERTHHTNYDTYERLQKDDLMQAAVVMATFVWETANRPDMLPRKPLSKQDLEGSPAPKETDAKNRPGNP